MKKVLSSLFAVVLMLCCGIYLTACGGNKIEATFTVTEISLEIGQNYDPFDFIEQEFSDDQKSKVQFKTEDTKIAYVNASNMIVPMGAGQTTLFVQVQKQTIASCLVNVLPLPIILDVPTNLHFNEEEGQLEWNYSYYELDGTLHTNTKYILEIAKDGGQFEQFEIDNTNVFPITEPRAYAYTARIQAKAASNAFANSLFSNAINFNLMGKPTNLTFDPETKTLSWQDTTNPSNTKYNITYSLSGGPVQTIENVEGKSFILDDVSVGVHTFQVTTIPPDNTYYKNQSSVLEVEQLGQVNLSFNNGVLSWNKIQNASAYHICIYLDGMLFEEEFTTETSSLLPKTMCVIASKNYEVYVQALGDDGNIFDGAISQKIQFEKLPLAEVVYYKNQNTFEVVNASFSDSYIKLSSQNEVLNGTTSLVFNVQSAAPYYISAQLVATNPQEQIDGKITTKFTAGDVSTFQSIQNLSNIAISYSEEADNAFVQYIEREPECTYTIYQNGQKLEVAPTNNAFALGDVVQLFATETQHTFSVYVEKAPTETTFFVSSSESLSVKKLSAPTTLTLEGINVKVIDSVPQGASHVGYTINGKDTNIINTTQTSWNITAKFIAQNTPIFDAQTNLPMFYSSGASTFFQIKRLDKVDGLKFDYTSKNLVYNSVLEADHYLGVCGVENVFSTQEKSVKLENVVGKVLVYAYPQEWMPITTATVGYIESLPNDITIYQVADIQNLWLEYGEDKLVTAKWTPPDETYGKSVSYSVFVKNQDDEYILEENNITGNQFTFDERRFDNVGDYAIKVQLDSPNKDFLTTETNQSVKLSRLAAPTKLSRNENTLKITDFNEANMLGVVVKQNIDGTETTKTQDHDTITIGLQDCQTLTLSIKFLGEFDASVNKYNLGSLESVYTIKKLGSLKTLNFDSINGHDFKFSWIPYEENENGIVPNYINYEYYTSNNDNRFKTNQKSATISDATNTAFTFFVREVATNESWFEIDADGEKYLSSDTFKEVQVYKESQITDLTATISGDEVKLSWKHKHVEEYTPNQNGYVPTFTLVYTNMLTQAYHVNYITNAVYIDGEGQFEYKYSIAKDFKNVAKYTIAISASSIKRTLQSKAVVVTFNKLEPITNLSLNENIGTFINSDGTELDTTGVANLVVSGAVAQVDGANIDLSLITPGAESTITVYRKAQIGEVGILNYYLDSTSSTFSVMRLEAQDVQKDLANNMLSWQNVAVTNATLSYMLKIESSSGWPSSIIWEENSISLNNSILASLDIAPGTHKISVRTMVSPMVITTSQTGYLPSSYGKDCTVEKLATVKNLALAVNNAQEVLLSFDEVVGVNASEQYNMQYNIFIADTPTSAKNYKLTTSSTSITCGDWFTGTKHLFVQAVCEGTIPANMSTSVCVVQLEKVNTFTSTEQAILSWGVDVQVQILPIGGYVLEVLDASSQKQYEVLIDKANKNFDLLSAQNSFVQTLEGGKFVANISVKGAKNEQATLLTLTSAKTSLEIIKLFEPTIEIQNNKVVVSCPSETQTDVQYFVTISNGTDLIFNDFYSSAINLGVENAKFEIAAYATTDKENVINSNTTTPAKSFTRLAMPTNLVLSTTADAAQENVSLAWAGSENASGYEIYVNEMLVYTAASEQSEYTFDANLFKNAGSYQIKMRAIAPNIPYSAFTENVVAIRLAEIEGAYIQSTGTVQIPSITQANNNYKISLSYADSDSQTSTALLGVNTLSYDGFYDKMIAFSSGTFFVDIRFVGDGVMQNGEITLSSANVKVIGFKLESPTIQIAPNKMQIQNKTTLMPNETRADTVSKTLFGIEFGGVPAILDDGTIISNFEQTQLDYPSNWNAGQYIISAIAKPLDDVVNVLPSNISSTTVTRLAAPTNLRFIRAALDDEIYISDENTLNPENYLSQNISFNFDAVENANGYLLNNGVKDYDFSITATTVDVSNTFESFVYGGSQQLNVIAIAKIGTNYINSAPSQITFRVLEPVESITTNGEVFEWQTQQSDFSAFLIAAVQNQADIQRFWQSTSPTQRSSTLIDLQFEGAMTLNIKILGNVSTTGTATDVVLDSQYIAYNQQFTKLAQIKDLATDKGLLTFTKVENAENYIAQVYEEDNLKLEVLLEDFTKKLSISAQAGMFVGYSYEIAELPANVEYQIKVYATSTQNNVVFSNPSDAINAKILENKNAETPLELVTNQYGQLDKKKVRVALDENAKGVWVIEDSVYTAFTVAPLTTEWAFSPNVIRGGDKVMQFAGFGTTQTGVNGHYLTSSFSQITLTALDKPQITIVDGVINWTQINGADGYYVYINENLFDGKAYYKTALALDTTFGGVKNKSVKIEVVPVVVANDKLWGPKATYEIVQIVQDTETTISNQNFVQKLHLPNNLFVSDGSLLWSNGITGLDNFNATKFDALISAIAANVSDANITALEQYIENLFANPITIYSSITGFNELIVDVTFTRNNFIKTIQFDAFKFLTLTITQKQNLQSIITKLNSKIKDIVEGLDVKNTEFFTFGQPQRFETMNHYYAARLSLILQHFDKDSPILRSLLLSAESPRYPSINAFFEELENDLSAEFAAGTYSLTIQQLGNDADWLDSSISIEQDIYIPPAATNLQIIEKDYNYYLIWDAVTLDSNYIYSASLNSNKLVYGVYGQTQDGNRSLITTTSGDAYGSDGKRLSLDLTKLIESGAIDSKITQLFLVVMGNTYGATDQTAIVHGLKSAPISITVLPQVQPSLVNGILQILPNLDGINATVKVDAFEISAANLQTEIVSGETLWAGENLIPSVQYALSIRFVGADINENAQEMYVLSGKNFDFYLTKLAPMNVTVNQYGVFEWQAPENTQGFALKINNGENAIYIKNPLITSYENQTIGFNNFKFQSLGQTCAITSNGEYFMTSEVNNTGYGIDAVMLTAIDNVFVEDGLIKWQPLDLALPENNSTSEAIVGYKLVFNNGKVAYTTNLSSPELSKDENGNMCLDFTNFGEMGAHKMQIQAFAQLNGQGATTLYNGTTYNQLLGQTATLDFNKIDPPRNIEIINGEIVWTGNAQDENFVYELSSSQGVISGTTTETSLWPENIAPSVPYTFKVKAYQTGSVYSSFASYVDVNNTNASVKFEKLAFANPSITKTTKADGNYIQFTIGQSAIDLAVNMKYKINNEAEYSLLKYGDAVYDNIINITNGVVNINVTALQNDIQTMEYMLQLVPTGSTTYIASNFTSKDYYVTPQALDSVYFDETTNEYFFKAENYVGYIVKDELFDDEDNLVATYYYQFSTTNLTTEPFFKQRLVSGKLENTISFAPVIQGFKHQVSVAVCEMNTGVDNSLMSPFVTSAYKFDANMFGAQTNIFAAQSEIFSLGTRAEIISFLTQNAFGSAGNAFTISNEQQFANLNMRLQKYSYQNTYTVQIAGIDINNIEITDTETKFNYKQTKDIDGVNTSIGLREVGTLGSIKYQGFAGIYDGQNFALSYGLESTEENDNIALFRVLENGAELKNLKVIGHIAYNGAPVLAGLVGENNGAITNIEIVSLDISNLELTSINFITLSFGGVVAQNNGTIQNVINNAQNLEVIVRISGINIYVGGIAAQNQSSGKILQCGNNMILNITSMHNARVGGIAGFNNGEISECFNNAQITALAQSDSRVYVGGIVGYNDTSGNLNAVLAKGGVNALSASANVFAGGIVGFSKNANIAFGFSTVSTIITQTDVENNPTKYGGTLFGWIDATTGNTNLNFYVNTLAFGKEGDEALFDTQQVDISTTSTLSNLVSYMNTNIGNNVFVVKNADIVFVWENA